MKKTVLLGASMNPSRYSYLAIQKLASQHHPVIAIGRRPGKIGDVSIITDQPVIPDVDTVTIYLNQQHQKEYYNYILSLHPKRIIFNPGAENEELFNLAKTSRIEPVEACTLVMLSTGQY